MEATLFVNLKTWCNLRVLVNKSEKGVILVHRSEDTPWTSWWNTRSPKLWRKFDTIWHKIRRLWMLLQCGYQYIFMWGKVLLKNSTFILRNNKKLHLNAHVTDYLYVLSAKFSSNTFVVHRSFPQAMHISLMQCQFF